jgi:hypothetical protein
MVGADLVLTGRVVPVGKRQDVTLQLHDSVSGALVAAESRSADGPIEALDLAPALVQAAVRKLLAPPPPIGAVEPGNYLEVRALGAVTALSPREGDLGCAGRCVGSPADLLVGYRIGGRWAVELGLLHTEYYRIDAPEALRGTTDYFVAGVEWSPRGSRFFSVAGYAGAASLARELRDGAAVALEDHTGWVGGGELRLKLNLRLLQLGVRAGVRATRQAELVSPAGTRRLRAGTLIELPISLSFRLL